MDSSSPFGKKSIVGNSMGMDGLFQIEEDSMIFAYQSKSIASPDKKCDMKRVEAFITS